MLVAPLQAKELAAFSLTSLEREPVRHLIPLSYLDMGVYAVPANPPQLAPEDAALVQVMQCKCSPEESGFGQSMKGHV